MANLNLSQFTTKTLVEDADWVFVWDTAGAISKKVSRNSLLNSGTLVTSAPVTISQTWNAVGQTFKALVVDAAGTSGTNSAAASLLLDLQLGTVSKLSVDKSGIITLPQTGGDASALICGGTAIINAAAYIGIYGVRLDSATAISWAPGKNLNVLDTILLRDGAANTLALRNGAAPQTFNVYGTSSSSNTVYERMFAKYNGSDFAFQIGTETAGATLRPLNFVTGGTRRMTIGTDGNIGIGTTTPTRLLTVVGDVTGTNVCLIQNTNSAGYAELAFDNDTPFAGNIGCFAFGYGGTATADPNNAYFFNRRAGSIFFGTTGAERMRVTAAGNVGIGTTAPSSKLQVTGGDVEIETVTSGIIMKAAGTSTRYRITLNAGGTALVFTAI